MSLVVLEAPVDEPVSLADVRTHLRLDNDLTQEDPLLTLMISAARRYAEKRTSRSFITQSLQLVMDGFPGGSLQGYVNRCETYSIPPNAVLLERGPVQSLDSIVYIDMAGVTQSVIAPGAPDYAIDLASPEARVTPGFGRIWPIPLPVIGSVRFNYTAGYGDTPDDVPETVRIWMFAAIQTIYRNRGLLIQLARGEKTEAFAFIDGMLDDVDVPTV